METPSASHYSLTRKKMSGAQKRGLKKARLENEAKLPKITSFPTKTSQGTSLEEDKVTQTAETATVSAICHGSSPAEKEQGEHAADMTAQQSIPTEQGEDVQMRGHEGETREHVGKEFNVDLILKKIPTDKELYSEPLSTDEKTFIISNGPCQPPGPFPQHSQSNRLFSQDRERGWVRGVCDWHNLKRKIDVHEGAVDHQECSTILDHWRLNKTVSAEAAIRKEANFWRQVLDRIINVTLTLATSNLASGGHREDVSSGGNCGNFLFIITLIEKYDPVLQELLNIPE
ncbi:uncharacterized protein LOC128344845 [Hemicordylus capensis]|uniref:uncharacterized protein LOC128344845 n=1 Tax=Hemicordylus capensis TaxID=884348 RepID=UPI0023044713|nr:uncharacterized protein LOC128344845 [Hemicordylus capensis]XP_053151766.1 uncharacterized protein LOC128344845 [Hemicordylus capensis]